MSNCTTNGSPKEMSATKWHITNVWLSVGINQILENFDIRKP